MLRGCPHRTSALWPRPLRDSGASGTPPHWMGVAWLAAVSGGGRSRKGRGQAVGGGGRARKGRGRSPKGSERQSKGSGMSSKGTET